MLNYRLKMRNVHGIHYSFPCFAPEGSQNLYVIVPTASPTEFENVYRQGDETENNITEEILPDFRCKICSETIPNYSDFKIHEQAHKTAGESLFELHSQENYLQSFENYLFPPELPECRNDIMTSTEASFANEAANINSKFKKIYPAKVRPRLLLPEQGNNSTSLSGKVDPTGLEQKSFPVKQTEDAHVVRSKLPTILTLEVLGEGSAVTPEQKSSNDMCAASETSQGGARKFHALSENRNQTKTLCVSNLSDGNSEQTLSKCNKETYNLLGSLHTVKRKSILPITEENKNDGELSKWNSSTGSHEVLDKTNVRKSESGSLEGTSAGVIETNAELKASNSTQNLGANRVSQNITPTQTMDNERNEIRKSTSRLTNQPVAEFGNSRTSFTQYDINGSKLQNECNSVEAPPVQLMDKPDVSNSISKLDNMIDVTYEANLKQGTNTDLVIKPSNRALNKPTLLRLCPHGASSGKSKPCSSIVQQFSQTKHSGGDFRSFQCPEGFNLRNDLNVPSYNFQEAASETVCVICKSTFSSISSLRKHLLMFHCKDKDRRQCPYCSYSCFQTSDLQKHIARRHTRDFKFKCSFCIKGFATPKELINHTKRKHSDPVADMGTF